MQIKIINIAAAILVNGLKWTLQTHFPLDGGTIGLVKHKKSGSEDPYQREQILLY